MKYEPDFTLSFVFRTKRSRRFRNGGGRQRYCTNVDGGGSVVAVVVGERDIGDILYCKGGSENTVIFLISFLFIIFFTFYIISTFLPISFLLLLSSPLFQKLFLLCLSLSVSLSSPFNIFSWSRLFIFSFFPSSVSGSGDDGNGVW